jgi:hypothetical protein
MYKQDIKAMHTRLAILSLFLISSAAFAAVTIEPINLTFAVPIVAISVVAFLATANMLSTAIGNPRLKAWAKTELREFFAALVLIVAISAAFIGSTGLSETLTGEEDYVDAAQDTIDGWLQDYDVAMQYIIRAGTRLRISATYSPYMNIAAPYVSVSYSSNPIGGVAILLISLNMAASALANVTYLYEGIRLLVLYLKVTVPEIFLPLAFILRLIPFTRKSGNTLIAVAVAGIVFLPFGILFAQGLNDVMGDGFPEPVLRGIDNLNANPWAMKFAEPFCESKLIRTLLGMTDPAFATVVCYPTGPFFGACFGPVFSPIYPLIQVTFQIIMVALMLTWTVYFNAAGAEWYAKDVFDTLHPFLADVNNVVLMGYLDFILIVMITVAGARGLSSALGGEWYMAGIQRLI